MMILVEIILYSYLDITLKLPLRNEVLQNSPTNGINWEKHLSLQKTNTATILILVTWDYPLY